MTTENSNRYNNRRLLLVVDYNPEKGGVARVGYLMYRQLAPKVTVSLFGKSKRNERVIGCDGNVALFFFYVLYYMVFKDCREVYCDMLGKATALIFMPNVFISKFVIFLHDEEAWFRAKGRHYMAMRKATHLVCNSNYTFQRFIKTHPEFSDKTKVCLLAGVPTSFYNTYTLEDSEFWPWFSTKPKYCVFVSRLWKKHRYKGYLELLDAFAALHYNYPDSKLKLVIIGRGDDERYVASRIQQYGLQDRVYLFNNVNDKDLVLFYQHSEALMFPSSREGFGYVFLEAMFAKKACIGLKGQPAEEIIEEGKSGFLLQDNQPETLLKVLRDIDEFPEKYSAMGEIGYEIYHNKFTFEHFKERFESSIAV
ncbi:glycosyltransferase family 4 protein [Pontibacter sp. SGAir0037]|uniref:glycosyltransferase family 4 protein n=1 Tax=Pontibacter sp. SGAir0037 TaxID=2571030 RepID=UPI0010CD4418|nr:glycosyltransferase family 4 protein [Pontibacter sp. SGAir0037]QCR22597.1 hypothetical protein C1N53_09775 [Pontibacter sp. SGAir0037]